MPGRESRSAHQVDRNQDLSSRFPSVAGTLGGQTLGLSPLLPLGEPPDAGLLGQLPVWTSHRVPTPPAVPGVTRALCAVKRGEVGPVCLLRTTVFAPHHAPGHRPGTRSTIAVATVGSVRLPGPWDARSLAGLCFWAGLASISTSALTPVSRGKRPAVPTVEGLSPPSGRADARRCPSPRPRHRQPALPVLAPGPRLTPSAPGLSGLSPRALPGLQLAHSKGWTSRPA